MLTDYSDVKNILLNSIDFRSGNRLEWISRQVKYLENKEEDLHSVTDAMNSFVVMMNPPEHTQLRTILLEAWDNRDVDQLILENINSLLNKIQDRSFDLVRHFAEPLPAMTMTRIMGLPIEDYQQLKKLATSIIRSLDIYLSFKDLVQIDSSSKQFIAYLNQYLDYRESHLSNDLVSKVIYQHKKIGIPLERRKMISICLFLFTAGEETTVNLIGTGLFTLLKHPDQLHSIMANPPLLENAADEALRFESPVQLLGRIANKDLIINGVAVKENETLTLCLGAANRDPKIFQRPDSFDIMRNAKNHLGFGAGIHFCLGSWLAKKQWKMAVQALLTKFPTLQITEAPVWNKMLSVRGLTSLTVSC